MVSSSSKSASALLQIDERKGLEIEPVGDFEPEGAFVEVDRPGLVEHPDHGMDRLGQAILRRRRFLPIIDRGWRRLVAAGYHGAKCRCRRDTHESSIAAEEFWVEDAGLTLAEKSPPRCPRSTRKREEQSMCRVFAGQDPEGYRQINRSIRIAGHSTSIQLEVDVLGTARRDRRDPGPDDAEIHLQALRRGAGDQRRDPQLRVHAAGRPARFT